MSFLYRFRVKYRFFFRVCLLFFIFVFLLFWVLSKAINVIISAFYIGFMLNIAFIALLISSLFFSFHQGDFIIFIHRFHEKWRFILLLDDEGRVLCAGHQPDENG